MPVAKIERIIGGVVTGRVERGSDGFFVCHDFGSNVNAPVSPTSMTWPTFSGRIFAAACA